MKTVAVFGASGVTGTHFVDKAIAQGWKVCCLSRSELKEKVGQTVIIGQTMDASDVKKTLVDENSNPVDAVVIALGHNRISKDNPWSKPTTPANLIETAMGHILKEMKELGIKRLVYVSAYGVGEEWKKMPFIVRMVIRHSNIIIAYRDHEKAEKLLESESAVDYTILHPPMLTDALEPTLAKALNEGEKIATFAKCTRISVGWFAFQALEQDQHIKQKAVIIN